MGDLDILFVDDNSPDGTGEVLDEMAKKDPKLMVKHRAGKQGIGSAHKAGIAFAYAQGYQRLITMDCDFTHMPADVVRLLEHADTHHVVVGSRFMLPDSLPGWNLMRRFLTNFGHMLTVHLLGIPQDATGGLRVMDLEKIPPYLFEHVKSDGYSYFFESMFLMVRNGITIKEIPISLPARMYGSSKMTSVDATSSGLRVLKLWVQVVVNPKQFRVTGPVVKK
jgi:dolichol-phosphate mannosyltransferase